jgi:hypothetical protein
MFNQASFFLFRSLWDLLDSDQNTGCFSTSVINYSVFILILQDVLKKCILPVKSMY